MIEELEQILKEATQTVEDELALEDKGWIVGGVTSKGIITEMARTTAVQQSRLYWTKDPLAKQAIRLWTDYTFGTSMTWSCEDEKTKEVLEGYWNLKDNQSVLSSRGQRKCSDKLLVDGEVFFALFLGNEVRVRLIDPLEITEIITDPDDRDNERYYKRDWCDAQSKQHTDYYSSHRNTKDESCKDWSGKSVQATENAKNVLVYHLTYNTLGQRGMPLLLPALDWIKQYRRFLASRVAVMLALARFAWKTKVQGGTAAVAAAKAVLNETVVPAGSVMVENQASDMQPIKTDTGASNANADGRMLKLQVSAATGWPEQYFGDISTGNLATAKTVELPVLKMCQSYQAVWSDAFKDMDELVLEHFGVAPVTPIDRDFPAITPEDAIAVSTALSQLMVAIPKLADVRDVIQVALLALGINNTGEVLDEIEKQEAEKKIKKAVELPPTMPPVEPIPPIVLPQEATTAKLINALREYKVSLIPKDGDHDRESKVA
uniref:Putative portal protein n=1 Tax=viral metagenome TaxID=1070528 RepID=A0A6M3IZK3_9ZZZZ